MSARGFVAWMAMLTFYFLTIVSLVTFFMVHCWTANGSWYGNRSAAVPESVAARAAEWPRGDSR